MTDEEKKAVFQLKDLENDKEHLIIEQRQAITTILNLIKKQSKEIEGLKASHIITNNKATNTEKAKIFDVIDNSIDTYIEELNKSDASKEQSSMKYYNLYRELVDKIKSKIEEVEQWELYNMKIPRLSTLDERLGAKIGIKYVLQSLLEKE